MIYSNPYQFSSNPESAAKHNNLSSPIARRRGLVHEKGSSILYPSQLGSESHLADVPLLAALSTLSVTVVVITGATTTSLPPVLFSTVTCLVFLGILMAFRINKCADLSFFLLIPIILSAFQNLYLAGIADNMSESGMQFLIILNYLYAISALFLLSIASLLRAPSTVSHRQEPSNLARQIVLILSCLTVYSVVLAVGLETDIVAALGSYRNLSTPFLFTLLGLVSVRVSAATRIESFTRGLGTLGLAVVFFGIYELMNPTFWPDIGIAKLWGFKGVPVDNNIGGVPVNFYSSELINGQQIRRMVSTFADPVNLGTFLYSVIVTSWYMHRRVVASFAAIAVLLVVSKGGFVSLLVFLVFFAWWRLSRAQAAMVTILCFLAGLGFLIWSSINSLGSLDRHVSGLISSLEMLLRSPFGIGLGNGGVLATRFFESADGSIGESGLGVVIGQLGIVGLLLYAALFICIHRSIAKYTSERARVLAMSLFWGFIANFLFNELTLSPNSAAPYFLAIGIICATGERSQQCANRNFLKTETQGDFFTHRRDQ